jgi:hypothetical protein
VSAQPHQGRPVENSASTVVDSTAIRCIVTGFAPKWSVRLSSVIASHD